jgi:hypothetical protein
VAAFRNLKFMGLQVNCNVRLFRYHQILLKDKGVIHPTSSAISLELLLDPWQSWRRKFFWRNDLITYNYITEQESVNVLQIAEETGKMLKGLQKSLTND